MRQSRVTRKWGSLPFVEGATSTLDLPLGLDLESVQLYISGLAIVIGTAYTGVKSEGLSKLVKRLEVMANGETVATMNGEMLVHGNFPRLGGIVKTNPVHTVGTTSGEAVGFLDFAHIGGVRPKDSVLRTAGFRQLQLRITWGHWTDVFTGAGAVTSHDVAMAVALRETADHGASHDPEVRRLYRLIEKTYPSSQEDRIPLDPNLLYRGIVIRAESAGELSGAVILSAKVQIGSDTIFELTEAQLDDMNQQDYAFALPSGVYVVDFAPAPNGHAKVADFLDTTGRNGDAFLILNVAGGATNKVQLLSHQFQVNHEAVQANRVRQG